MRLFLLSIFLFSCCLLLPAQRRLPKQSKEEKAVAKMQNKREKRPVDENKWLQRTLPGKSKGVPVISAWHSGTAGIIPGNSAELSLFNPSRIGFTKNTELLFRIGEEWFLSNAGLKHRWWGNDRFVFSTEHTLYYTYPLLKILQSTGFKDLVPDTVSINQGFAMRNEFLFSWLMNPREFGCPDPPAGKILTFRAGVEFYGGIGDTEVRPFDYLHSLYHTQLFDGKLLYYGGFQFDSYFSSRFHYSVNTLFYSVDFTKQYAAEANLRFTYYIWRKLGVSASCKAAYINVGESSKMAYLPLLDFTYLINPDRGTIRHGLFKNKRRYR